ncbi:hypothetical protein [Micromonospora sp. NPDC049891]|uniref:hypothetical protein n=1 Tax=Micromonospora sp. NPDC049891 TaxID=3155655 RepID=UPI0033E23C64
MADEPAHPRLLVNGIVGLATSQYLDQRQRATALHVMAAVPDITYLYTTTDLAGRPGLSFQVYADGSTSTVGIDPTTGELLAAHERISGGLRPDLFSYVLLLDRGHTSTDTLTSTTAAAGR